MEAGSTSASLVGVPNSGTAIASATHSHTSPTHPNLAGSNAVNTSAMLSISVAPPREGGKGGIGSTLGNSNNNTTGMSVLVSIEDFVQHHSGMERPLTVEEALAMIQPPPLRAGILQVEFESFVSSVWTPYWFQVVGTEMYQYQLDSVGEEDGKKFRGQLVKRFDLLSNFEVHPVQNNAFELIDSKNKEKVVLKAADGQECIAWIETLKTVGSNNPIANLSIQPVSSTNDSVRNRRKCHLVMVLPGFEPASYRERNLDQLSKTIEFVKHKFFPDFEFGLQIDVQTVDWTSLIPEYLESKHILKSATIPTLPYIRNIINTAVSDMVFFKSSKHWKIIITEVIGQMNTMAKTYLQNNQEYQDVSFSVMAHNMGAVIFNDILQLHNKVFDSSYYNFENENLIDEESGFPSLRFPVENFFAVGSPHGIFGSLDLQTGESLRKPYKDGWCKRFFNIFHPYDPLAYRMEPLFHVEYESFPPVIVPHWRNLSFREYNKKINIKLKRNVLEEDDYRIDYVLQPKYNVDQLASPSQSCNNCYWTNKDAALMMITQIVRQLLLPTAKVDMLLSIPDSAVDSD